MTAISPPRVVSLIASATEIVHALGAGDQQIARSHECDWPPSVVGVPVVTSARPEKGSPGDEYMHGARVNADTETLYHHRETENLHE